MSMCDGDGCEENEVDDEDEMEPFADEEKVGLFATEDNTIVYVEDGKMWGLKPADYLGNVGKRTLKSIGEFTIMD